MVAKDKTRLYYDKKNFSYLFLGFIQCDEG